jgi:hypothetical protein
MALELKTARTRANLGTLLETMRADPDYFKDKRILFWLWPYADASRTAEKEYEKQRYTRRDDDLLFYELTGNEAKSPPDPGTTILGFYYEPNTANLKFDGIDKVADHIVKVNNRSAILLVRRS